MILSLLLTAVSVAAPNLGFDAALPVKKELQAPAPKVTATEGIYSEVVVDFESFEDPDTSKPKMTTHSDQLLKFRRLPAPTQAKDAPKDPFPVRTELTYERMISKTVVQVPVLGAYPTNVDVGAVLSSHPLLFRGDESGPKKADNLAEVKAAALSQGKDLTTRTTLNLMLKEDALFKVIQSFQSGGCLDSLAGKKPGDKWKVNQVDDAAPLESYCTFEGWSEAAGKKVVVLKVSVPKQRAPRQQMDGSMEMAETEGEGEVDAIPETGEALYRMTTRTLGEPAADKIRQLEASGAQVKRTHSTMKVRSHVYPI